MPVLKMMPEVNVKWVDTEKLELDSAMWRDHFKNVDGITHTRRIW